MNTKKYRGYKPKKFSFLLLAGLCLAFFACSDPATPNTTPTVTSVTVNPPTASVDKGGTQKFTATVSGTNSPAQTVTWSIVETGKNSGTTIKTSGLLTVAAAETLTTLTVKATSTVDTTKSDTATVTVITPPPTVTSVTISPPTASIAKGGTRTFTATVAGTNRPEQTVTWSIVETGKNSDTTINNTSGLLTVAAAETLSTLTVKAASTVDDTKSGTATVKVTNLDTNAADAQTFTANSGGNRPLSGSPYGYEMWTKGGNDNKLIWYGPNQGGGAAFRAEWNNPDDFLGRIGYFWGNGESFTQYKNMYADFTYTRSRRSTAGDYSYIGIYGWSRNPSATDPNERLIEYYIVEDWFGNQWVPDTSPMTKDTTGGNVVGNYTLDGATYSVIKNVRTNQPSIDGTKTFTQYFSIRQTLRKTGTISITEHFKKWDGMGMKLDNMYEAKFLVEAGGGTGWLDFSNLQFSQEDTPRP